MMFARPVFQGKLSADVAAKARRRISSPVRSARSAPTRRDAAASAPRSARPRSTIDASAIRQKPEAPFKEAQQAVDLSQAERIVAVGRGIKGQEHLKIAEQLAQAMGAEIAASRPICDAGWLPMDRQIGSSGQTVARSCTSRSASRARSSTSSA